jgi:hypothetical protein
MIDPLTALAGIQTAVALIKKVSKTVDDVSSLGPVLGKYFDAKSTATKAVVEAKKSGNKSNMGAAIEIELALHQAEQFERELQMLFMASGKIDVWNKIKARSAAMDADAAYAAKRQRESDERRRKKNAEDLELALGISLIIITVIGLCWGLFEVVQHCQRFGCGN